MATYESELEQEFEQELELHEGEGETAEAGLEGEGILGALGSALGGLFGEGEGEGEGESELHELQELHEFEGEGELEGTFEGEGEFFKKAWGFLKRAAPILRKVAKVAAPMVATAIGGPIGGILGKAASSLLEGEGELGELGEVQELGELHELGELPETHELEGEFEGESEMEIAHEITHHEATAHEYEAEIMAQEAAHEQHEYEAEALAGVAAVTVISPADRRALRRALPHMVRGITILTRILRRRRVTRPAVRAIPTIVRQTMRTLRRQSAAGVPITRKTLARATAHQVRRVLGSPRICAAAISRNVRTTRLAQRRTNRLRRIAG